MPSAATNISKSLLRISARHFTSEPRKRSTRDDYLALFNEVPLSRNSARMPSKMTVQAPKSQNAPDLASFKVTKTQSNKIRVQRQYTNPRPAHLISPSQKKHSFFQKCQKLAHQGKWRELKDQYLDKSEFSHKRYRDIADIVDTSTDEAFMANYVLALVNDNKVEQAEEFILDRIKTRISPNGYIVPQQPFVFCNLIKGFARRGNVKKVREWVDILHEEVPQRADNYKSLTIGFQIMALTHAGKISEALTYFWNVVRDYAPQFNDALERELEEEAEMEAEDRETTNRPSDRVLRVSTSKRRAILTAQTVTPLMQALASMRRAREVADIYAQAVIYGDNVANDINIHNTLMDAHVRIGDEKSVLNILSTYFAFKSTAPNSSIVEALQNPELYDEKAQATQRRKEALLPNEYTLMIFLRLYAARGDVDKVEQYYREFLKNRPNLHLTGRADSMRVYARVNAGDLDGAQRLFEELYDTPLRRDEDSRRSRHEKNEPSPQDRFTPTEDTYTFLLYGYAKQSDMDSLHRILSTMRASRISIHKITINTILRGLIENGDIQNAREIFHDYCANPASRTYVHPDVLTFNVIMRGFAHEGQVAKVEQLMSLMKQYSLSPNEESFQALLQAHLHAHDVSPEQAIAHVIQICGEHIPEYNWPRTYRNLAHSIADQGNVELVQLFSNRLAQRNVAESIRTELQNALLMAHVKRGDSWGEVYLSFQRYFDNPFSLLPSTKQRIPPNANTYIILMRRLKREKVDLPENTHLRGMFEREIERLSRDSMTMGSSESSVEMLLNDEDVEMV